jgi:hypothetical protein
MLVLLSARAASLSSGGVCPAASICLRTLAQHVGALNTATVAYSTSCTAPSSCYCGGLSPQEQPHASPGWWLGCASAAALLPTAVATQRPLAPWPAQVRMFSHRSSASIVNPTMPSELTALLEAAKASVPARPDAPPLEPRPLRFESRRTGVIAIKAGMMQDWDEHGARVPLTVLWIDDCRVRCG